MSKQKVMLFITTIALAIITMFIPTIIIGKSYEETSYMASLLTAELIMRIISVIVGTLILYDGIKKFFSDK